MVTRRSATSHATRGRGPTRSRVSRTPLPLPSSFQPAFFTVALLSSSIAAASHSSPSATTSAAAPPSRCAPVSQHSLLSPTPSSAPAHNSAASTSCCYCALVPLPITVVAPICCIQPHPIGHPCHFPLQSLQPTIATSFPQLPPLSHAALDRCSTRAQPLIPYSNNRSHNQSPRQPQSLPFLHPRCHQLLSSPPLCWADGPDLAHNGL
ncbi:hypothetical protein BHE74_00032457 [Ensete ventricosum]|nr:hypothetical protein BHE74_00032457 [Ensete ventricosum]